MLLIKVNHVFLLYCIDFCNCPHSANSCTS